MSENRLMCKLINFFFVDPSKIVCYTIKRTKKTFTAFCTTSSIQIHFPKGWFLMPRPTKKATVSDIARRAGVSAATVSRVMNDADYPVRAELRERVLAAAAQLNYKPNVFSQMLKGGSSREIGIVVPSITNLFYAQLVSAVEEVCLRRGYTPIICSSQNSPDLEKRHLENLERKQVEGVLLSGVHLSEDLLETLSGSGRTFVLFDQTSPGYTGDCVGFDFFSGGYMATKYLLDCGHRDIAFISGPIDRPSRNQYFDGYRRALRDAGARLNNRRVVLHGSSESPSDASTETEFRCGWELARNLLQSEYLPDAVVAINDMIAIGAIKYFESEGIHVPRDISVIGFDDISISAMVSPALTTIAQPATETGRLAAQILLDRLEGKPVENSSTILEPKLIERESVRRLHKKVRR